MNPKSSRSCSYCTEVPELAINNMENCEFCWEACKMADGTFMFVNTKTDERFGSKHISDWRRYWHYDMHCKKKFWWCCGKRWFFEPSVTIAAQKKSNEEIQKVLTAQTVDLPMANTSWFSNSKSESNPTRRIPHL